MVDRYKVSVIVYRVYPCLCGRLYQKKFEVVVNGLNTVAKGLCRILISLRVFSKARTKPPTTHTKHKTPQHPDKVSKLFL